MVESCHIHITDPRIMACRLRNRKSEQYQDIGKIWAFVTCINMTCLAGTVFGNSDTGILGVNPVDGMGLYP